MYVGGPDGIDPAANFGRCPEQSLAPRHVQERLVQRERFHQRRVPMEDFPDRTGGVGVIVDSGRQKYRLACRIVCCPARCCRLSAGPVARTGCGGSGLVP